MRWSPGCRPSGCRPTGWPAVPRWWPIHSSATAATGSRSTTTAAAAYTVDGPSVRLSATPGGPRRAGPGLNEHLVEVLGGLLGYDDDRIAALAAEAIFQ